VQIIITKITPNAAFFFTSPVEKSANADRAKGCSEIHSFVRECE
jgi:hypothetical protein